MEIKLKNIPIREVVENYQDSDELGVTGFGGKLNIRPAFQREFIYKEKQRDSVIQTVKKGFPLNVMYWVQSEDGHYEILDGQQRTISICQYVQGDFSIGFRYFHNLTEDEQREILDYELMIYFCVGTDKEKLDWFKTINIAGEQLSNQELRNAIYTGPWLTDAKKYFSKTECPAYQIASDYMTGSAIRQDYLETALKWITSEENTEIEDYMSVKQHMTSANELWLYFSNVINWVKTMFPNYRKEMKGIDWGIIYNKYHMNSYDPAKLETRVSTLMEDEDVTKSKGIYEFVLGGPERLLSIRAFSNKQRRIAYENQNGVCPICHKKFKLSEMEADHKEPWSQGGHTIQSNCQMLCKKDNREKAGK